MSEDKYCYFDKADWYSVENSIDDLCLTERDDPFPIVEIGRLQYHDPVYAAIIKDEHGEMQQFVFDTAEQASACVEKYLGKDWHKAYE